MSICDRITATSVFVDEMSLTKIERKVLSNASNFVDSESSRFPISPSVASIRLDTSSILEFNCVYLLSIFSVMSAKTMLSSTQIIPAIAARLAPIMLRSFGHVSPVIVISVPGSSDVGSRDVRDRRGSRDDGADGGCSS
jgi:hypothetical protein